MIIRITTDGSPEIESGGAHSAVNQILNYIGEHSDTVELHKIDDKNKNNAFSLIAKIMNYLLRSNTLINFNKTFEIISKFEKRTMQEKIDLIWFLNPTNESILLRATPYITTVWDLGHLDLLPISETTNYGKFEKQEYYLKKSLRKAFRVIVDSSETGKKISNYYGIDPTRIVEIPFMPLMDGVQKNFERTNELIYPANFWAHKNHIILFQAIANLKKTGIKSRRLLLTGNDKGHLVVLKKLVNELDISNEVDFLGFINEYELLVKYKSVGGLVFPSKLGPTNFPPLESLNAGTPTIVSEESSFGISNLTGVKVISSTKISDWMKIFDEKSVLEKPNSLEVSEFFNEREKHNKHKVRKIISDFTDHLLSTGRGPNEFKI